MSDEQQKENEKTALRVLGNAFPFLTDTALENGVKSISDMFHKWHQDGWYACQKVMYNNFKKAFDEGKLKESFPMEEWPDVKEYFWHPLKVNKTAKIDIHCLLDNLVAASRGEPFDPDFIPTIEDIAKSWDAELSEEDIQALYDLGPKAESH